MQLLMILQVLCLDECTANVDNQTAFLLQSTISSECKGMTVLTIAHRISTVMQMDNILVLDQGKLVSCDTRIDILKDHCKPKEEYGNELKTYVPK
jgi:ATP-binding cassette subfamily C (CFTR/MRP) protein 10